jgi:hypothetical protein
MNFSSLIKFLSVALIFSYFLKMVGANSCDDGTIVCKADENCYASGCCPINRNICAQQYSAI